MADTVEAPEHYAGDGEVDCMRAMRSMQAGWGWGIVIDPKRSRVSIGKTIAVSYWLTTAFKYIWRWPFKGGLEDIKKARRCIDYAIAAYEGSDVA